jgi:hypothetical protein
VATFYCRALGTAVRAEIFPAKFYEFFLMFSRLSERDYL